MFFILWHHVPKHAQFVFNIGQMGANRLIARQKAYQQLAAL